MITTAEEARLLTFRSNGGEALLEKVGEQIKIAAENGNSRVSLIVVNHNDMVICRVVDILKEKGFRLDYNRFTQSLEISW